jgi:hypothetical protein
MADCIRRAWLTLGDRTLPLEDDSAGYACTELDLGYPEVREVTANRPDQDGIDDRTRYMGSRAMAANIRAYGGTMSPDEIGAAFAPYMVPNARPELHYVLERPGAPERFTVVRPADYAWPISGKRTRDIHLGWVAADPILRDPTQRTETAYAGSSTASGRTYPLHGPDGGQNRLYPPGGNSPTTAVLASDGDVVFRPLLRIYGPITNPAVSLQPSVGSDPAGAPATIRFVSGYVIGSGQWVDVDTATKTAYANGDPTKSVMAQIDWAQSIWPTLPTLPYTTTMSITGDSTSGTSQVVALWYDGFLT